MFAQHSRRDFLKYSALGLAANAASTAWPASAQASTGSGGIEVWVTDASRRFSHESPISWKAGGEASEDAIHLMPDQKFQEVLGFGAAFTDAACYMFNELDPAAREKLFHELFHPSEMGFSVCRTCIGSSDYSTKVYSFDEADPDPELTRFSIDHDRAYILPMLSEARKVNPDIFLFSSPWSPPGWMKSSHSMLGGNMRRQYMPSYANYFVKFLRGYAAAGVPIDAVTVQNEVDTDQDGRMPACIWPQEYEVDFIRNNLGPTFRSNGIQTKIWMLDHNYNLWGRVLSSLEAPGLRDYCNAVAWHGYVGKPEAMTVVHKAYPKLNMYWTEGGPDYTDPQYATNWCDWSKTFTGILQNWCQSITAWNFALDEHGRPNIGPFSCGGLVTINSQTKDISYSGQYWAFAHYSRLIRRGAHRFASDGKGEDVTHAAFENPDGSRVLVVTNAGPARTILLAENAMTAECKLAEGSVTTFVWH